MTDLVESSTWTPGIRQFETSDPVEGGPDGIDNVPLRQLANRTRFLKDRQEAHEAAVDPYPQYATKADLAQKAPIESPVFTGAPKGTTPGQFDSSTRLATTAFVQRALGSFQMSASLPVGTTNGSVADIGKYFTQQGAAAATYALPSTTELPSGAAIGFKVTSNFPLTIQCNGGDVISANGQTLSSLTLGTGDDVMLVCPQKGFWFASGSAVVGQSSKFAASLNSNGYQKLPSGLIIQWGLFQINFSSTPQTASGVVTYPLAFPNGALSVTATSLSSTPSAYPAPSVVLTSASQFTAYAYGAVNNVGQSYYYTAIGR
ncbi:hypothetical protein WL01_18180 [Burkholderia ubonensis]|uniref:gp53-like domain-containing protein n=1 Tax=Burkholderia ubonensis TaxID=101571 RepID=UPI000753A91A|nr:hypothetical protein [Burkholderia ubonensis]KVD18359.1 hypothetical protein WI81_09740 [Burkholderia ubonensis]KVD58843.1 hypothetical protein WI87_14770 [Burkholderia ubonensis]KVR01042.1 hypothetical protein WK09_32410 [Burkholderia ubonensis]KVX15424.1 hypothetical protein WL01_18180 [Burkholderia ubonensis]KVZ06217.1 hypothetical protein WL12_11405 [Burkholderia ubonensis]